ncbi:MAG: hypothetical protein R3275_02570 [Saprospiraceae bacterium]|nr:hypothetical protein [Saprospiraceae bacterium]
MKALLRIGLTVFVLFTVLSIGLQQLFNFFEADITSSERIFIWSILQGLMAAFLFMMFQFFSIKSIAGKNWREADFGMTQSDIVNSRLEPDLIADLLSSNFKVDKSLMRISDNDVEFKTGISISSYGEKVSVKVVSEKGDTRTYQIRSQPRMRFTILDVGKNYSNIRKVRSLIAKAA